MRRARGADRTHLVVVVLVLLLAVALPACQPDRLRAPVALAEAPDFPDPTVFWAQGRYQAFATQTGGRSGPRLQVMTSPDLGSWTPPTEALAEAPAWAWDVHEGGRYWAPTVGRFGTSYVLYFAANHRSSPVASPAWCIGWASSTSAAGPFTPGPAPLLCQVLKQEWPSPLSATPRGGDRGVIDAQISLAPNGATYLVVKALDNPIQVWGMGLTADGRGLRTQGVGMLRLGAKERVWEYSAAPDHRFTIVENPTMDWNPAAPAGYQHVLYYSGGDYRTADYATGAAACEGPIGPCVRITTRRPWLASRGDVVGPGGLSVFRAPGGARWVAYHSWRADGVGDGRRLHVEPLGYDGITAVLLSRPPTGTVVATLDQGGAVVLSGRADDPDTGLPVEVIVKEGDQRVAVVTSDPSGSWRTTVTATPGRHRWCTFAVDDHGLGTRWLACTELDVPVAGAGAPSAGETTTTSTPSPTSSTSTTIPTSATSTVPVGP